MPTRATREQIDRVFMSYGRAMFHTQVLELTIVSAFLLLDVVPKKRTQIESQADWEALVESCVSEQLDQTLGRMILALANTQCLTPRFMDLLKIALAERNRLAHGYFYRQGDFFGSAGMCDEIVSALSMSLATICEAGEELERYLLPVKALYGIEDIGVADSYEAVKLSAGNY